MLKHTKKYFITQAYHKNKFKKSGTSLRFGLYFSINNCLTVQQPWKEHLLKLYFTSSKMKVALTEGGGETFFKPKFLTAF